MRCTLDLIFFDGVCTFKLVEIQLHNKSIFLYKDPEKKPNRVISMDTPIGETADV